MQIDLKPIRLDATLDAARAGDALVLNGVTYDFSAVGEGDVLDAEEASCPWLAGNVRRVGGRLHVPLLFPIAAQAPEAARFPEPVVMEEDGPVPMPDDGHR